MCLELISPPIGADNDSNNPNSKIQPDAARIMVMGVGGGGGNSVNFMMEQGVQGAEFILANTDMQVLLKSTVRDHIQLGPHETRGLGAGGKPEVGELASREVEDEIAQRLKGVDLLFLTAGMGGGTGTGATPVIAEIARKLNILTVAIVTKPFAWEGPQKAKMADAGIKRLRENIDTLIVVPNENLESIEPDRDLTMEEGFEMSNRVLLDGVRNVTEIRQSVGRINVDFRDLQTTLEQGGMGLIGTGRSTPDDPTEERAILAANRAINNPLLERSNIQGAQKLLIHIRSRKGDLRMKENTKAMQHIQEALKGELQGSFINGIFETDDVEEGCVEISIIATGLDAAELPAPVKPEVTTNPPPSYPPLRPSGPPYPPQPPKGTTYPNHPSPQPKPAAPPMPIPQPPKVESKSSGGLFGGFGNFFKKPRQQVSVAPHPVKTDNTALPQRPRRDIDDVKTPDGAGPKTPDYLK
ncbi:cell division protein FtsZ [Acetobacteraceae bacterium]|nr:cell division protein FtsZ [Acetobacteraceae bacterium]